MADDKFDQDDNGLGMFPSAANPLTAMGIDPDMARANPDLLAALNPNAAVHGDEPAKPIAGPVSMPTEEPEPASSSAKAAGALGGAQAPPPPQSATDYGMAGLSSLNQNAKMATDATADIPTTSPEIDRLAAQRAKFAAPAPLYDPQTGKMLDKTTEIDPKTGQPITINPKPSAGTRIWRGVRGGLQGLLAGGIRGGLLGAVNPVLEGGEAYGAPNKAYQSAEQQREETLGSTDASLKTAFDNWKQQVNAGKERASEFRANATLGKDLTTGSTGMQNAATDAAREKDTAAKNAADSPEAKDAAALKLNQQQVDQRTARAAQMKLSPLNRTLYILNGKVPDPREPNEAEVNAAQAARALVVFKAQHNGQGPQTLEDFNSIQAAARGALDKGKGKGDANNDDEVGSIVADATEKKQQFADQWKRQPDGSYTTPDFSKRITAAEFQDKIEGFRTAANAKLAKKGAKIDDLGNLVHKDSDNNPQADLVTVQTSDGKGGMVTGTIPRANLAAAQKRDKNLSVVNQK